MSYNNSAFAPWLKENLVEGPAGLPPSVVMTVVLLVTALPLVTKYLQTKTSLPLVNPPKWFQLRAQKELGFLDDGMETLRDSRAKHPNKPFRILTELGEVIVLPPEFAQTIRNLTTLNFRKAVRKDFHGHLPGFEPYALLDRPDVLVQTLARKQLTKRLITQPLSDEASFAIQHIFGNVEDWKETEIKTDILDLIARLSSRIFLGEASCRNEEWLDLSKSYTITSFRAAMKLNKIPRVLRGIANIIDQDCRQSRQALSKARRIVEPVVAERRQAREKCEAEGVLAPKYNDAIDWAETEAHGKPYDVGALQLVLSFAAIHTTTDLLTQTLIRLANEPDDITALRAEIIDVLKQEGWKKSALFQMKLLDSAIKESQRIKPNGLLAMRRIATEDVKLPDGLVIRKGERINIDGSNFTSPEVYDHPEKFDIHRFKNLREQPGREHKSQLVATSPDHLSFGHGYFACPGRFFAANEIKVALCHLLLKYDWKLAPGETVEPKIVGAMMMIRPELRLMYRRRKEEIDVEALDVDNEPVVAHE
ncbi:cytochrome p450 monooxygenase [Colletotrichum sojae]|uniref:Cytochrome p450 monooxygenase n=1 Tax=Colletotrichum sojae TaxID=2175907 RepID=A0A8H6MTY5_9PEZI|nr:cytochrome p450 monooxygenase [Colletotrichum sojae]